MTVDFSLLRVRAANSSSLGLLDRLRFEEVFEAIELAGAARPLMYMAPGPSQRFKVAEIRPNNPYPYPITKRTHCAVTLFLPSRGFTYQLELQICNTMQLVSIPRPIDRYGQWLERQRGTLVA